MPAERRLATVLFLDIVGSTHIASDLGDRRWRELLTRFRRTVRAQLKRFHGHEEDTAGDGVFATFPQPANALRAAEAIVEAVHEHGLDVRCGLHFGEAEVVEGKLGGIAVHIGARVMSVAGPAEILVTSTIRDLVAGAGVEFDDLSMHELKGVPGTWQLFAARKIDDRPIAQPLTAEEAATRISDVQVPSPLAGRRPALIGGGVLAAVLIGVVLFFLVGGGDDKKQPPPASPTPLVLHEAALRLDPTSGEITRTAKDIAHGGLGFTRRMAFGEDGVWVIGNSVLTHVDPRTGEKTRVRNGGGGDVAVGDHEVWVATAVDAPPDPATNVTQFRPAIAQVDPQTDEFLRPIPLGPAAGAVLGRIAVGGGNVWYALPGSLVRVDEGTHDATHVADSGNVNLLAAFGSQVWLVDQLAGVVRRVDPGHAKVADKVTPGSVPSDIAVGPAGVWIVSTSAGLAQRIGEGGTLGDQVHVGEGPIAVAVGTHIVWVANRDGHTVAGIDPDTNLVVHEFPVPGSPVAITVDPRTDTPWVYVV